MVSMTAVFVLALVASCCAGHPARAAGQNGKGETAVEGASVELEGELDVLYEDDDRGGRLRHFLIERDRRIPLYFEDGADRNIPSGSRIRVTGRMRKDGNLEEGGLTVTSITVMGRTAPAP